MRLTNPARYTCRIIMLILGLLLVSSAAAQAKMVSVAKHRTHMRSGPGTKYAILWQLDKGYPLKVLGRKGNWTKVSDFEGDEGWIHKKLLNSIPHLIVKKERINIRSGPGTNYRITGVANYGVVLRTIKRGRGWVQVEHEDGLRGWVQRDLVWGW